MNRTILSMLNKSQLIDIITSDKMWQRKACNKIIKMVSDKINSILDEQDKCDLMTLEGRNKYKELEEEYKKWSDIQDSL